MVVMVVMVVKDNRHNNKVCVCEYNSQSDPILFGCGSVLEKVVQHAQQHAQKKEGVTYRSRQCGWQSSTLQHQKNGNPTSKGDRRARFSRNRAKSDVWYGSYLHQWAAVVVGVVEEFSKEKKQEGFDEYRCQSDPCFFGCLIGSRSSTTS